MTNRKYIKLYGLQGSGSNQLRMILSAAPDVTVLMHVLGDKHQPPSGTMLNGRSHLAPLEMVKQATLELPAETTDLENRAQLAYLEQLADPLWKAVVHCDLYFAISIQHPYRWVYSALARLDLLPQKRSNGTHACLSMFQLKTVTYLCEQYNERNLQWFFLRQIYPGRVIVVPREDTFFNVEKISGELAEFLDVKLLQTPVAGGVADFAAWDNLPPQRAETPADSMRRASNDYVHSLGFDVTELIDKCIDWDQYVEFGYAPQPMNREQRLQL